MLKPPMFVLPLLLAGCAAPPALAPAASLPSETARPAALRAVTAVARLDVRDRAGRALLAAVGPWTRADVDHVKLELFRGAEAAPLRTLTIASADLAAAVSFEDLEELTDFKVVARAWANADETTRIDDLEADAAACTTTFSTQTDSVLAIGSLKLRLRAKTFQGTAGATGVTVTDGLITTTTDEPAIELI